MLHCAARPAEAGTKSRALSRVNDEEVGRVARPVKGKAKKSVAELEYVDGKLPLPAPRKSVLTARPSVSSVASESSLGSVESSARPRPSLYKKYTRVGANADFTAEPMPDLDAIASTHALPNKVSRTSAPYHNKVVARGPSATSVGLHRFEGLQGLADKRTGDREAYTLDELDFEMLEEFWEECCNKCGSLKKAFNRLDVGLNARIRKREFKTVGDPEHLNCKWLQEHFLHIFWLLDTNEDSILRFDEFNGERLKPATPVPPDAS